MKKEQYDIIDGRLKNYTGSDGHIVIPSYVTEIDDMVFFNNTDIRSLTIPGNVRRIGQGAFFNCANLESVSIGTGVCEIASFAFKGCTSLKSVVIPDTIVQIEADAFDETTTIIKESSVDTASKEESVSDEDKKTDRMFKMKRTNGGWMVERYIGDLSDITVPEHYHGEKVVSIGEMAFAVEGEVTTDENGDEKQSFSSNDIVRSVMIPSSVRYIEDGAFMACINLEKIQLSEGLESVGGIAFWGCEKLKSIEFPESCREIGDSAFEQCISLKTIKLNEGLRSVGEKAFLTDNSDKIALKELTFPSTLSSVPTSSYSPHTKIHFRWSVDEIPQLVTLFVKQNELNEYSCFNPKSIDVLKSVLRIPDDEQILLASDATVFESGKRGWIWTDQGIYQKEAFSDRKKLSWYDFFTKTKQISVSTAVANTTYMEGSFSLFTNSSDGFRLITNALEALLDVMKNNIYTGK